MTPFLPGIVLLCAVSPLRCADGSAAGPAMVTEDFEFRSGGRTLSGMIDQPANGEARALLVFVHGSGMTDVRRENRYFDLRSSWRAESTTPTWRLLPISGATRRSSTSPGI